MGWSSTHVGSFQIHSRLAAARVGVQQAGGDAAGCNPLPLLARDRWPPFRSRGAGFCFHPTPVPTRPSTPSTHPPRALTGLTTGARCLLLGLSSHPPAQPAPCPPPLFLLIIPFISPSSLHHPICLPLLLPTALQHKSGRSLAGSRVRVLRGWGATNSVGRKGDCTLSTTFPSLLPQSQI